MSIITVHTFVNNPPKESKLDKLKRLYKQTLEDRNYCKSVQAMYLINKVKEAEIQSVTNDYEHHISKQIIKNNYLNLNKFYVFLKDLKNFSDKALSKCG